MAQTASMDVQLTFSQLRAGQSGSVLAPIWVTLGGTAFPMEDWWDFPVVVLGSLAGALVDVGGTADGKATSYFFDGPYEIRLQAIGDGVVRVEGAKIGVHDMGAVLARTEVRWMHLAAVVEDVAVRLLEECERTAWTGPDVRALFAVVSSLQRLRASRGPS